ncbi:hypothetical protein [Akkermansia phage Moulinsart]|nr:hypothetical protein [Akkermansia phage Moulinsart]
MARVPNVSAGICRVILLLSVILFLIAGLTTMKNSKKRQVHISYFSEIAVFTLANYSRF